jgi:integrase
LQEDPLSCEEAIHPEGRAHILGRLQEATQIGQFDERLRHSYTTLLRQNDNDPKVVQGLLRWASPKMMNVYHEAVAPEKRTAHEELLKTLSRRTAKRTADDANFVSA